MTTYTITLTDAEQKALEFVAVDAAEWISNAVHDRCRVAIEQIVAKEIERKLAAGETISGSKEDIVNAANIKSAAEREAEHIASLQSE